MGLYDKWLRFWADKPVLDLVDLIDNNPELVRIKGSDAYMVGDIYVYTGDSESLIRVGSEWYWFCNSKLIRRALVTALVKQQAKESCKQVKVELDE